MHSDGRAYRIAAILAGGNSRRMGDIDKAKFEIGGLSLIDIVKDRVMPQADEVLLSAKTDYETGLKVIPDHPDKFAGPVAGLWAVAHWVRLHRPATKGFFTVPVDAPLISYDLFDRLEGEVGGAIAETTSGVHPTFGYWETEPLLHGLTNLSAGDNMSLKGLAEKVDAVRVQFQDERNFSNINYPQDAEVFKAMVCEKNSDVRTRTLQSL